MTLNSQAETESAGAGGRRRICIAGPAYPYRGGISHHTTCLARELAKRHEVNIFNFTRLYPELLFPGRTQYDSSTEALAYPNERCLDSLNPWTWFSTARRIASLRPDALLVPWWHPFFAPALACVCRLARRRCGCRNVFLCHNVLPHERSLADRLLTRLAFGAADGFVVQSKPDLEHLLALLPDARAALNPHPRYDCFRRGELDRAAARQQLGLDPAAPLLLFFGYVRAYKGLQYLLEAMPAIRSRLPAQLLVVGEFYEGRAEADACVRANGLESCVRFIDRYVPNEEVEAYFMASDLVVLPYLSATQSGIVQIAMSFDRPVLVTAVGGLQEVVEHGRTGLVVPPGDTTAIAAGVAQFFHDGLAAKMAPHFAAEQERFSWSRLAATVEGLLDASQP